MIGRKLLIHIPKNGGMSIRHDPWVKQHILFARNKNMKSKEYVEEYRETMEKAGEHPGIGHARWRDFHPNATRDIDAFAVIRNPWQRVVSRYFFARQAVKLGQKYGRCYENIRNFQDFLDERKKFLDAPYYWHRAVRNWQQQLEHVTDEQGNLRCSILRTEHLNKDLSKYFRHKVNLKKRNVTTGKQPWEEVLNDETINLIGGWYQEDIEFFGFSGPDSSANKNIFSKL